jgi:hypothetical protein
VLEGIGPVQSFTLLNSHGHADHVGNNDLIHRVSAEVTQHYLSEAGLDLLDARSYFATQFRALSAHYDPVRGYRTHRIRWRAVGALRDVAQKVLGADDARVVFRALPADVPAVLSVAGHRSNLRGADPAGSGDRRRAMERLGTRRRRRVGPGGPRPHAG